VRRVLVASAVLVLTATPLTVVAADAGQVQAGLVAGAASVDITPPAAGTAPDPADCRPVGTPGIYDGPRQFALEEPYKDLNGNGHYDAPDPANGVAGEPFLDCPTPTALGGLRPPDGRWDGIYLGGGDCCDRLASKTLDPLEADALVVANGSKRIAIVTADNEGVFKEIWDEVRAKVAADGVRLDAVFPSSTHDESAPDTIGITGPTQTTSGVDPFYVEFLVGRISSAIEKAAADVQPARVRYGRVLADDLMPCWSSYPFTADESVGAMQVVSAHGDNVFATLVNYGIHAEDLGFSSSTKHYVSGDWWHFLRTSIRARYGDSPVLSMAGMVGSVEMPRILSGPFDRTPVGEHEDPSLDGCRTIYQGPPETVPHEGGYDTYTKTLGERVAGWAERALDEGAWSRSDQISYAVETIQAPVTNLLFLAAGPACVFDYRILYTDGIPTGTGIPPACGAGNQIATDVGYFRIGDGSFVTAPGELFPFTYAHDFHGASGEAAPTAGPVHGWVLAQLGGRWRFVQGLGEDLSGYIFPADNEVGTPTPSNPNGNDVDRFGCHHVDDAEASSGQEGDVVDDALTALLPRSPHDQVRSGRYVYADGSLHRDPTGDGLLGCDPATSGFTAAPGGGAVGVTVATAGATSYDARTATTYTPGSAGVQWMDLDGRPQAAPDQQTRGFLLPDGTHVWVDVYAGP